MSMYGFAVVRYCYLYIDFVNVQTKNKLDAVIKTVIPARKCLPLNMKHPVT